MKWTYFVQQKLRIASLLALVMGLIIVTTTISKRNVEGFSKTFDTMYKDRLVPATDIFYLTENLYAKRALLEKVIADSTSTANLARAKATAAQHNKALFVLVEKYGKTYLVDKESKLLAEFKKRVEEYILLENSVIHLKEQNFHQAAAHLYGTKANAIFKGTITDLAELTAIQSSVGNELVKDSETVVSFTGFLFLIQNVLVLVIGAVIMALIMSSRTMHSRIEQNIGLN